MNEHEETTASSKYSLRAAEASEAPAIALLVELAYEHYVERLGFPPRPMQDDYAQVITSFQVMVAEDQGAIIGLIVLNADDEGFLHR